MDGSVNLALGLCGQERSRWVNLKSIKLRVFLKRTKKAVIFVWRREEAWFHISLAVALSFNMAFRFFFSLLSLYFLIVASSAHDQDQPVGSVSFTYGGSHGPANWGSISPEFKACSQGKSQSPIDIVKDKAVYSNSLKPLDRTYHSANATLFNNGFSVGLQFEEYAGTVVVDGKNYTLKQMHWHAPSEHLIDGQQFAAELHLVHKTNDGSFAVVGILYQIGDPDPFVSMLEPKFTEMGKEVCGEDEDVYVSVGNLDTKYLMKKTRKYFRYVGSFTSPPCSENVHWHILGKVRTMSKEQVEMINSPLDVAYRKNARPVQELSGRQVEFYDELYEQLSRN